MVVEPGPGRDCVPQRPLDPGPAAGYKREVRFRHHVFVCENRRDASDPRGCCSARGGEAVREALKLELKRRGLAGLARANAAGCLDACEHGPTVVVYPEGVWYGGVKPEDVAEIVESHLVGGRPVERLRIKKYD